MVQIERDGREVIVLAQPRPPAYKRLAEEQGVEPVEFLRKLLIDNGSIAKAAESLDVTRQTLYLWLAAEGLRWTHQGKERVFGRDSL